MLNKIVMKKTQEKQKQGLKTAKHSQSLNKLSSLLYSEKIKQNPDKKKRKYQKHNSSQSSHSKIGFAI
jgi:hypothetical protein